MSHQKHGRSESPETARKQRKTASAEATTSTGNVTAPSLENDTSDTAPVEDADPTIDLTAINSIQSPLLRLPAELRNKIWTLAFGNNKVQVVTQYVDGWDKVQYRINTVRPHQFTGELFRPIPLVSEQLYHEATDANFSTSTFACDNSFNSKYFIKCPHNVDLRRRIQYLDVSAHLPHFNWWLRNGCLEYNAWHEFRDLKGLRLTFSIYHASGEFFGPKADVLNDKVWKKTGMTQLISAAKQHALISSRLSIEFIPADRMASFTKDQGVDVEAVTQQIRAHLLDHRPIRRTGRERKKAEYNQRALEREQGCIF